MSGEPTVSELLNKLRGKFGQATTQTKLAEGERATAADEAWLLIGELVKRFRTLERERDVLYRELIHEHRRTPESVIALLEPGDG